MPSLSFVFGYVVTCMPEAWNEFTCGNTGWALHRIFKPLNQKSDQHLVSPENNTAELLIWDHENKGNDG